MKVRALARISGATGDRDVGDEFDLDAAMVPDLEARKLVEKVRAAPAKPSKAETPAEE